MENTNFLTMFAWLIVVYRQVTSISATCTFLYIDDENEFVVIGDIVTKTTGTAAVIWRW